MGISIITNEHPDFYPLIGPFLSRRWVVKAYGDTLWDDDGMTWAVARTEEGSKVMGFAALTPRKNGFQLCNDYVLPEYRDEQNTVQAGIIDALLEQTTDAVLATVTADEAEQEFYQVRGFVFVRRKGRFLQMARTTGEKEA